VTAGVPLPLDTPYQEDQRKGAPLGLHGFAIVAKVPLRILEEHEAKILFMI
jgi:hypothetical protein